MKHTVRIVVGKAPPDGGIAHCRRITVRERLARFFLGEKRQLAVIVPGDSVKLLSIEEAAEEGGAQDGQG